MQEQIERKFSAFPWQPVISTPNPMHNVIIYRAQSILTVNGEVGPVLEYKDALEVIRQAELKGPVK